jgi:hypothetical protein
MVQELAQETQPGGGQDSSHGNSCTLTTYCVQALLRALQAECGLHFTEEKN